MADEIAVAETGASAASTEAAAPAATPTETPAQPAVEAQGEQQPPVTFDESLFNGLEPEAIPEDQQVNQYLSISPYIQDEQTLQNAIARQGQVEAVLQGQAPASALFEPMRQQNPQQWAKLMEGVVQYAEQITGMKFMDPAQAGGQQLTPEQQRIAQLEAQQQSWQQQQAQERQQQIVNQAQKQLLEKLPELTKGRLLLEGESPDWLMEQLGYKLQGKEQQVVAAIAKGDYSMVEKAIKQINNAAIEQLKARNQRLIKHRTSLQGSIPKTPGTKGSPDLKLPSEKVDIKDPNWFGKAAKSIWTQ